MKRYQVCLALYLLFAVLVLVLVLAAGSACDNPGWGDLSSRGQLALDLLLLPAVTVGLFHATEEFRASQSVPDLDVYWIGDGDRLSQSTAVGHTPSLDGQSQGLQLAVANTGQVICRWYMLEFTIPRALARSPRPDGIGLVKIVGDDGNWKRALRDSGSTGYLFTFMSNGQFAAYPHYPVILGEVRVCLFSDRDYLQAYEVPYKIASERGKLKKGSLTVSVYDGAEPNPSH